MTDATGSAPDIGSVLRQARIRRGQSLEVVSQQTRIPKKMLEALESNRFDEFPAVVYLRGFLKNYCDHLDIEFDPLWQQIDPKTAKPGPADTDGAPAAAKHEPAPQASDARAQEHADAADGPSAAQLLPFLLIGGLLVSGIGVWLLNSRKPAPPEPVVAPPQPPREIAPMQAPKEMALRIVARQDSWMQLQTDGVLRFQGRAPAGLSLDWKAMDAFVLRTKDPSALSVFLDGKEVPLTDALKNSAGDYKIVRP
ncbi:MAG: helix-turn-helix domain-containing protein [Elusimicrobia bacterium]|nr:helix-turn-helix domain-containing protein [Elusimicrobiota bacterium]